MRARKLPKTLYGHIREYVDFYGHPKQNRNRQIKGVANMESHTCYYARVLSKEQNLDRQIIAFKALGASDLDIITDKESGKDLE